MDPFERALHEVSTRYGWKQRVTAGIRKRRAALASHPVVAARELGSRFALSREAQDALVQLAPMAAGLPVPDATLWCGSLSTTSGPDGRYRLDDVWVGWGHRLRAASVWIRPSHCVTH